MSVDVYQYCQELRKSDVLSARMIGWNGRWSMFGSFVLCCQCLNAQSIDDAARPFEHQPGCAAEHTGSMPWQELITVLGDIPRVPDRLTARYVRLT